MSHELGVRQREISISGGAVALLRHGLRPDGCQSASERPPRGTQGSWRPALAGVRLVLKAGLAGVHARTDAGASSAPAHAPLGKERRRSGATHPPSTASPPGDRGGGVGKECNHERTNENYDTIWRPRRRRGR